MVSNYSNRFARAQKKINDLHNVVFTDKDLRGLSKVEKEFIIDNDMHVEVICHGVVYYMFISRNQTTGKKQLYALSKTQSIAPNGNFNNTNQYNYQCWLVLTKNGFNRFAYEYRFTTTPNINMIFA